MSKLNAMSPGPKFSYWVQVPESEAGNTRTVRSEWAEGCAMPDTYFKGRPVYFGDTELRFCDSMFLDATYADTGIDLDEDELCALAEQEQDYLVQQNIEHHGYWED